jgi:hypothetical protein
MTTLQLRKSIGPECFRDCLLIALVLACLGVAPVAQAADGDLGNANTAEGAGALQSLTTGTNNTALGAGALFSNTTAKWNTATGAQALKNNIGDMNTADGFQALVKNTTGSDNAATGWRALFQNTSGDANTANGFQALYRNTTGSENTANGDSALYNNTIGVNNTANGVVALLSNTTGNDNTADGGGALGSNSSGVENTANGSGALFINTTGNDNTANGFDALASVDGGFGNIAVGAFAGLNLFTGNYNIDIGNEGGSFESSTIRIGDSNQVATFIAGIYGVNEGGTPLAVYINSSGQLGTMSSSRRFKKEIKPMDQTSEAILALKPVTFQYKSDTKGTPQFGLIAEEVAKVNPDLVVRDADGEPYTVRYEAVNAMLLNEFLKEHKAFLEEQRKVQGQQATITQLRKDFGATIARLDEQAAQIQKVSAQLEASKPAPQVVNNP